MTLFVPESPLAVALNPVCILHGLSSLNFKLLCVLVITSISCSLAGTHTHERRFWCLNGHGVSSLGSFRQKLLRVTVRKHVAIFIFLVTDYTLLGISSHQHHLLRHLVFFYLFNDVDHALVFVVSLLGWLCHNFGHLWLVISAWDYFKKEHDSLENISGHLFGWCSKLYWVNVELFRNRSWLII